MPPSLLIRPSEASDLAAITANYAWHVRHGSRTFETEAPEEAAIARRGDEVLARELPWLVAQGQGRAVGRACANRFRPRHAYRFCVEDSIYLAPDAQGRGIERLLLAELIAPAAKRAARVRCSP